MSPRLELALTVAVCAIGIAYFGWRVLTADSHDRLVYTALLMVGVILAHRAIRDVRAKLGSSDEDEG